MKIAIMSIGDELMNGFTIDSNSSWIAYEMSNFTSFDIISKITTKDNKNDIVNNLDYLFTLKPNYIFITGGLGPTHDDITKNILSEYFSSKLIVNETYYLRLKNYFDSKNIEYDKTLKTQAEILENSNPIPNRYGTALGMILTYKNCNIFVLPGVPKEMKAMIKREIIPSFIESKFTKREQYITILTTGIYESKLYELLKENIIKNLSKFKVSFLPNYSGVKIRISLIKEGLDLDEFKNSIIAKINNYIYGFNNDSIESVVSNDLILKKLTLALAESCTGGFISKKLTDQPGSSRYFKGGLVAYDNTIKETLLNVPKSILRDNGAVSSKVALAMANNVRKNFNTDIGLSTTGISGPSGGSENKPVGLIYIAITTKNDEVVKKFNLIPNRHEHRNIAAHTALNMLRLFIK